MWGESYFLLLNFYTHVLIEVNIMHKKNPPTWNGVWCMVKQSDVAVVRHLYVSFAYTPADQWQRDVCTGGGGANVCFVRFPALCVTDCLSDGFQLAMDAYISCQRLWQRGFSWFGHSIKVRRIYYVYICVLTLLDWCLNTNKRMNVCWYDKLGESPS